MRTRPLLSPVGPLLLDEIEGALTGIRWGTAAGAADSPLLLACERQLKAYFAGQLRVFELPLLEPAEPFSARIRQALLAIPYGQTLTYGALAEVLAVSPRAIGQAMGANPIPIIVPCHRVLAADGLGGYSGAGGVEVKSRLLAHEGAILL
jgi:methylated-DNA-[protein]-cysteine S-methyltransferase